mgnify:FL=1
MKKKIVKDTLDIPRDNGRESKKARKQILKDFYARWIADNPDKIVWNHSLRAYIHIKFISINETSGQASISYESTREVFRLSEILSNATLIKEMPPKRDDQNQRPYSKILVMKHRDAMLIVGKQRSTGEYVQYCVSAWDKK